MADNKIYAGTVGLGISIEMGDTITGATGLSLSVHRENGSEVTWTPTISGTTKLVYATQANDLIPGITKIQPRMTLGAWTGYGGTVEFTVYDRFA
jgi:hypothetical protein